MAYLVHKAARTALVAGQLTGSPDIRAMLVMTNTTADTEEDAASLAAFTTLDEYDGSGYARIDLASVAMASDDVNNRHELTAALGSFGTAVGAGVRNAAGVLYYLHVDGTAANDKPIAFNDTGGFPQNGAGGKWELTPSAEGLLQIA